MRDPHHRFTPFCLQALNAALSLQIQASIRPQYAGEEAMSCRDRVLREQIN